jgi:hypothetical protein
MIREKEVEEVKNIIDTERGLKSKRESVVTSKGQSDHENIFILGLKKRSSHPAAILTLKHYI